MSQAGEATVTLFRPVGQKELDLVEQSGWRRFPPRLPEQPIFYPVLNEQYAIEIARDWNTKALNSGKVGFVLRFQVRQKFVARYEPHIVGSRRHCEYWVPAEELNDFNDNIVGQIEVIHTFHGKDLSRDK